MKLFLEAKEDKELNCPFEGFENVDEAMDAIANTVKAVVITSGQFAPTLIPKLCLNQNIISFNVMCKNNG